MKSSIISLIIAIVLSSSVYSQEMNNREEDPETGNEILVGPCDRQALEEGEFGEIFRTAYETYETNVSKLMNLSEFLYEMQIVVVMGVWCDDSQIHVPPFMKILDELGIDPSLITIICVNREKKAANVNLEEFEIELVPTFIFKKEDTEIDRITESPEKTLEEDILKIVLDYKTKKEKEIKDAEEESKKSKAKKNKSETKTVEGKKEDPNKEKLPPSNAKQKNK